MIEMEEMHDLAAADGFKSNTKFPCWFHYKFGKCTKNGCKLDHEREAMTRYQDTHLQDLIKSTFADPKDVFMKKVDRYFDMKTVKTPGLKPKP
jgi:hypothetical protein